MMKYSNQMKNYIRSEEREKLLIAALCQLFEHEAHAFRSQRRTTWHPAAEVCITGDFWNRLQRANDNLISQRERCKYLRDLVKPSLISVVCQNNFTETTEKRMTKFQIIPVLHDTMLCSHP
jgi:hypothetical protein